MTEWLKRLRGYVKIRVWGFAPQRFINLCSNKGILLWNIEKQDDVYIMCVSLESFYRLRSIARKTKVRVVISERYGLPFFVPGMLRRKAFLAGLFLAVAFWFANEGNPTAVRKMIAGVVLFLMIGVVCDLITKTAGSMEQYDIKLLYTNCSTGKKGGGILAGSICYLLLHYRETVGTVLVVLLCSLISLIPVSYTHLTLPTTSRV
mgnify:CR=1 FL=1